MFNTQGRNDGIGTTTTVIEVIDGSCNRQSDEKKQTCLVCGSERISAVCGMCGFRHTESKSNTDPVYEEEVRAARARWKEHQADKQRIDELETKLVDLELRLAELSSPITPEPIELDELELDCGRGATIKFKRIEAGSFMMGGTGSKDEQPVHEVTFAKPFYMAIYPVTQAQYDAVTGRYRSWFNKERDSRYRPVEQVTWEEAKTFCRKLSQKTGHQIELPSEAQWEYCCRAGSTTEYCFGNDDTRLELYANYSQTPIYGAKSTSPVGSFRPNAWGLYDMHGNVWEWCEDKWHGDYVDAPADGSVWLSGDAPYRVRRGGCWYYQSRYCRSANRLRSIPTSTNYLQGFRVCLLLDASGIANEIASMDAVDEY